MMRIYQNGIENRMRLMNDHGEKSPPNLFRWGLSVAAVSGLTGMLCCVAPMFLFMFGLMGGTYAISFADFFYSGDDPGIGAWLLRIIAVGIGVTGVIRYRKQQNQCSLDPKRSFQEPKRSCRQLKRSSPTPEAFLPEAETAASGRETTVWYPL